MVDASKTGISSKLLQMKFMNRSQKNQPIQKNPQPQPAETAQQKPKSIFFFTGTQESSDSETEQQQSVQLKTLQSNVLMSRREFSGVAKQPIFTNNQAPLQQSTIDYSSSGNEEQPINQIKMSSKTMLNKRGHHKMSGAHNESRHSKRQKR